MTGRTTKILAVAAGIGADAERMKTDMNDPAIGATVERNLALAQALRIHGTPSFVAGDQVVRGTLDLKALQAFIAQARARR